MTSHAQPLARAVALLVAEHDVTDVLAHFLIDGRKRWARPPRDRWSGRAVVAWRCSPPRHTG